MTFMQSAYNQGSGKSVRLRIPKTCDTTPMNSLILTWPRLFCLVFRPVQLLDTRTLRFGAIRLLRFYYTQVFLVAAREPR